MPPPGPPAAAVPQAPVAPGAGALSQGYALKTPMGRAILFSILSFGIWTIWWFYVTRKRLDQELGHGRDDAALHTVLLFVPIASFFSIYWLWRDLDLLRRQHALPEIPVVAYVVLAVLGLNVISFVLALPKFNEYWDVRTGGQATDAQVTTAEKAIVGIGIAFWVLWVLLIALVIVIAATT
jgi:hypothetical protein